MGLAEIVEKVKQTEKGELTKKIFAEYDEQYHWWLAVALGLLIVEMLILPRRNPLFRHLNIFSNKQ
jgi:Ca-activated chloride channel family protein